MAGILDDLARITGRAFLNNDECVALDAIVRHKHICDEELARKLGLQVKQLRQTLVSLEKQGMVKRETRRIRRPVAPKPDEQHTKVDKPRTTVVTKLFWYMDYKHLVDIIKYKMYILKKRVDELVSVDLAGPVLFCPLPSCGQGYTTLEVDRLLNPSGSFHCLICNSELEERNTRGSVEKNSKLRAEFAASLRPIINGLKQSEGLIIPKFRIDNQRRVLTSEQLREEQEQLRRARALNTQNDGQHGGHGVNVDFFGVVEGGVEVNVTDGMEKGDDSATTTTAAGTLPPWMVHEEEGEREEGEREDSGIRKKEEKKEEKLDVYEEYKKAYLAALALQGKAVEEEKEEEVVVEDDEWDTVELGGALYANPYEDGEEEVGGEEEEEEVGGEEEEEEEEDDVLIKAGDLLVPLSKITQSHVESMTADQHSEYFEKYQQRLNELTTRPTDE